MNKKLWRIINLYLFRGTEIETPHKNES